MKNKKNIFFETLRRSAIAVVVCLAPCVVRAASSDGCENTDSNDYINQALALCSTHAYNIGATQNPESGGEQEAMNQVVALKSTIITQQMKKQYDYLEATVKRFKTQLEKAILTAQMQAAGASSTPGGADSGKSSGRGLGEDCTGKSRTDTVYCLRQNYAKMAAAVAAKQFGNDLKEQIVKDAKALSYMDTSLTLTTTTGEGNNKKVVLDCKDKQYLSTNTIPDCLGLISGATNKLEEGGKQAYNPPYYGSR